MNFSRHLLQEAMNPLDMAVRFLKNPLRNSVTYFAADFLSGKYFIPSGLRKSFLRSAAKRDPQWLRESLFSQNGIQTPHSVQYNPFRGRSRRKVAGSRWHVDVLSVLGEERTDLERLPSITLSFVTYNSARWLKGMFSSLLAQDFPTSRLNVHFIDNGSKDETIALITAFQREYGAAFGSMRIDHQENVGFGMGHDVALRASEDEFVLISNVDLLFHSRSILDVLRVALVDDPDVASWEMRQCPYEHPKYYDPVTLETMWSSYACILLRRSAYLEVGGFEERIFMYGEDVELSYRFRGAGYRLRYLPQVPVTHFVDFENHTLRPDQLAGSIMANLLLRHRYGDPQSVKTGERLLSAMIAGVRDPGQLEALRAVEEQSARDKVHFASTRLPKQAVEFPFNGLDYDITRCGHDVELRSIASEHLEGPLVTIVTRTFGPNTGLLREAIASVCNQTYLQIEHLIVEDKTEFAGPLVEEMQRAYGRNISYMRSMEGGRSAAGNAGLSQAHGDLLMFLDNDDLLLGDHVELLVNALKQNPQAPAAYSLAWEVPSHYDQNGNYREDPPQHIKSQAIDFDLKKLERGNFIPIQNILFRRQLFEIYGGFDPEIDHLEDWNLWCRYSQAGHFVYVPKTTAMYRVPGDMIFRRSRETVMQAAESFVRRKNAPYFASGKRKHDY